jgi:hypothetical protein
MSFILADEKGLCWNRPNTYSNKGNAKYLIINQKVKVTLESNYYISFWDHSNNKSISIEEVAQLLKCTIKITQGQFKSYGFQYETPSLIEFEKSSHTLIIGYHIDDWLSYHKIPHGLSWLKKFPLKNPINHKPNSDPQIKDTNNTEIQGIKKLVGCFAGFRLASNDFVIVSNALK